MCVCVFAPAGCEGVITHSSWGKRQRRRLGRERGGRETKSTNSRHKRDFRSAAEKQNKKSTDRWFQSSVCLSLWRGCVDRCPPGVSAGAPVPSRVDRLRGGSKVTAHHPLSDWAGCPEYIYSPAFKAFKSWLRYGPHSSYDGIFLHLVIFGHFSSHVSISSI